MNNYSTMGNADTLKRTRLDEVTEKRKGKSISKIEQKIVSKTKHFNQVAQNHSWNKQFLKENKTSTTNGLFEYNKNGNEQFFGNFSQNIFQNFNNA